MKTPDFIQVEYDGISHGDGLKLQSTAAVLSAATGLELGQNNAGGPNQRSRFRTLVMRLLAGFALTTTAVSPLRAGPAVVTSVTSLNFAEGNDGHVSLVQGQDGNIYGTTSVGGDNGCGVVFELTPAGDLVSMHSLAQTAKAHVGACLVHGADGNLYGVFINGGTNSQGGIFKLALNGEFTNLHMFNWVNDRTDASFSVAALVQGRDGNFYGTSTSGGKFRCGTVFVMTADGKVSVLHAFNNPDGNQPSAALVQGNDGNFYGTTKAGGPDGCGNIFKITPDGVLTVLYSFKRDENNRPESPLIQGSDGNFYGTTSGIDVESSFHDCGSIFKITPAGKFTTLHGFHRAGSYFFTPNALALGDDGNVYGTVISTSNMTGSSIFRLTPGGAYTTLHIFSGHGFERGSPHGALVRGSEASFYGTTDYGTVFKLANGATGTLTADESIEPQPLLETPSQGTDGTVQDGVLTYKDERTGKLGHLKVFRVPLPSAQIANALVGSAGSWVWISEAGDQARVLNVSEDGKVAVNPVPIQMAVLMRAQAGGAPR